MWSGTCKHANGNTYTGHFTVGPDNVDGFITINSGKCKYANGDLYEGEWKYGMYHGQGKFTYANGIVYKGSWRNGLFHGKGKFQYLTGAVYECDWSYGQQQGTSKFIYPNGNVYVCEWRNGMQHGQGMVTSTNMGVFSKLVTLDRKFKSLLKTTMQIFTDRRCKLLLKMTFKIVTTAIYLKFDPSPNAEGLYDIINDKQQDNQSSTSIVQETYEKVNLVVNMILFCRFLHYMKDEVV